MNRQGLICAFPPEEKANNFRVQTTNYEKTEVSHDFSQEEKKCESQGKRVGKLVCEVKHGSQWNGSLDYYGGENGKQIKNDGTITMKMGWLCA